MVMFDHFPLFGEIALEPVCQPLCVIPWKAELLLESAGVIRGSARAAPSVLHDAEHEEIRVGFPLAAQGGALQRDDDKLKTGSVSQVN